MSYPLVSAGIAGLLLLAGCASTSNRPVYPLPAEPVGYVTEETAADGDDGATAEPRPSVSGTALLSEEKTEEVTASPSVESAPGGVVEVRDDPHDVVVIVGGEPIYASELIGAWMMVNAPDVRSFLEGLIMDRILLLEAARLGVSLSDDEIESARNELYMRFEEGVRLSGTGLTTKEFIRTRLGLDPDHYYAFMARKSMIELLGNRVIRAWLLASDRAEIQVIRVDTRSSKKEVEARLAKGLDFADVARDLSIDESGKSGGEAAPVVRGESMISRLAFSTREGEVGGPVFTDDMWLFLRVVTRPESITGSWEDVASIVEASLRDRPIEDPEYWQWKAAMLEVHEVDMTPFLDLVDGLDALD